MKFITMYLLRMKEIEFGRRGMIKRYIYSFMLIGVVLVVVGCASQNNESEKTQEEIEMIDDMIRRIIYAESLDFTSTISDSYRHPLVVKGDYVEILFAHNEEEARELLPDMSQWGVERHTDNFPPNTIVAWPRSQELAQGIVNGIHLELLMGEIDLEEFSLSYPLTITDMIEKWEKVDVLWQGFGDPTHRMILGLARRDGADAFILEREAFQLIGSEEVYMQVVSRGRIIGLSSRRVSFELLIALGSAEDFFTIADRIVEEGLVVENLSAEEILEKLQE